MQNLIQIPVRELRAEARRALEGNWKTIVIATVVYMLLTSSSTFFSYVADNSFLRERTAGLFGIIVFVISGPLMLG